MPALLNLPIEPYDYSGHQYKIKGVNAGWHQKHVEPQLRNKHYPGTFLGPWMTGGSGYFLSKRAIQCAINQYPKFIDKEFYEDKLIGDIMRTHHMTSLILTSLKEIFVFDILFLKSILNRDFSHYASFHPCSPREMDWFYKRRYVLLLGVFFIKYIPIKIEKIFKTGTIC